MSRIMSRIAMTLSLLLATLGWATGPIHQAHALTTTGICGSRGFQICFPIPVRDCTDGVTTNPGTLRAALKVAQQLAAMADAVGSRDEPTIIFKCSGTITLSSTLTFIQGTGSWHLFLGFHDRRRRAEGDAQRRGCGAGVRGQTRRERNGEESDDRPG